MNTKILENLKTIDLKSINKKSFLMLTGSILFCLFTLIIGKLAISEESLIWYGYLLKPVLPPDWLFQTIWVFLSLLTGTSLYFILKTENSVGKKPALMLFVSQLLLTALWISVFFGLKSIEGGFAIIILLCITLYITFYKFHKISIPAAILLVPYLLWISYAVGLNLSFWMLNSQYMFNQF